MSHDVARMMRGLRACYDQLPAGDRAVLRRAGNADDLREEGVFWRLVDDAGIPASERARAAWLVACFDAEDPKKRPNGREPFASWLRHSVYGRVGAGDLPARAVRFRRALAARDRDALVHELRRLLRHGYGQSARGVDWGALGSDLIHWGDEVRRKWAEQFFTSGGAKPDAA